MKTYQSCFFSLNQSNMQHVRAYFAFRLLVPIEVMLTPGMGLFRQSPIKQTPHDTSENVSINAAVVFVS